MSLFFNNGQKNETYSKIFASNSIPQNPSSTTNHRFRHHEIPHSSFVSSKTLKNPKARQRTPLIDEKKLSHVIPRISPTSKALARKRVAPSVELINFFIYYGGKRVRSLISDFQRPHIYMYTTYTRTPAL